MIHQPQITAPTDNRLLAAVLPPAADAVDGRQSSGGDAGEGNGSGASPFTTCTNRIMPRYPDDAKLRREYGKVTLLVQLDERGGFADIRVGRSSGSSSLDAAGIAAIKLWKCSPVYERGRAVRVLTKQEFEFTLR